MKIGFATVLVVCSLLLLPCWVMSAQAQGLASGTKVRFSAEGEPHTGRLVSLDDKSLVLLSTDGAERMSFPIDSISSAEWLTATKSHLWWGTLLGGAAGVTIGVAATHDKPCEDPPFCSETTGDNVALTVGLGLVGAGAGGLIGYLIKTERWEPVPLGQELRIGMSGTSSGGSLNLSIIW